MCSIRTPGDVYVLPFCLDLSDAFLRCGCQPVPTGTYFDNPRTARSCLETHLQAGLDLLDPNTVDRLFGCDLSVAQNSALRVSLDSISVSSCRSTLTQVEFLSHSKQQSGHNPCVQTTVLLSSLAMEPCRRNPKSNYLIPKRWALKPQTFFA
jgi:hypothetical protein